MSHQLSRTCRRVPPLICATAAIMVAAPAAAMSLSFSWAGMAACGTRPPGFTLSGVPHGTERLSFRMIDLAVPSYPHGGGNIAYRGDRVPAGSFAYHGPCPPHGRHTYRWTVEALDGSGKVLARASAARPFPPR